MQCFVPLSLTDDTGKTLWSQDAPNVANSQRPLLVRMGKESQETLESLALFEQDIEKLANEGMVIGNHNIKLTIQGHMLDRKAAGIFTGLGRSYCDLCDFSKGQCLQKDIVESGFEITKDIDTLKQIFDELVNEDGSIEKCAGDYERRSGVTTEPITKHDVFDHFIKTAVDVMTGVYQWSIPKTSIYLFISGR